MANNPMDISEFLEKKPVLYGHIRMNGKSKFGMFKVCYNKYSGTSDYFFHTLKGNKGQGGFTIMKAWMLYKKHELTLRLDEWVTEAGETVTAENNKCK